MSPTALVPLSASMFESWVRCVEEFGETAMDGSGSWMVESFAPNRTSFELLLHHAEQDRYRQNTTASGHVPCSWFWISDGDPQDPITGFVAVRHNLDNEYLARTGGHIGYSVRPSRRRRGHAAAALSAALDHAAGLGLDRVLITCAESNVASAGVIEGAGGVYESTVEEHRRYWVRLRS